MYVCIYIYIYTHTHLQGPSFQAIQKGPGRRRGGAADGTGAPTMICIHMYIYIYIYVLRIYIYIYIYIYIPTHTKSKWCSSFKTREIMMVLFSKWVLVLTILFPDPRNLVNWWLYFHRLYFQKQNKVELFKKILPEGRKSMCLFNYSWWTCSQISWWSFVVC